jgi:patatin-like phospholipase/acyl hydrolase
MSERLILSIDGGGIRGIIPARVLQHIESLAGCSIATGFDLMAGTSTGGLLALGLATSSHRLTSRIDELVTLYLERGERIFDANLWRRLRSANGLLDERYPHQPLESELRDFFGDRVLGDAAVATMVPAYALEQRKTLFLKTWHPRHAQVPVWQAARATAAAPTYFEPMELTVDGEAQALIDGGIFMNSPAVSAYAEALKRFPGDSLSVLSLGTGELTRPIHFEDARHWGKVGWVRPLIDCMFDGIAEAADYQMRLLLGARYQRLQLSLQRPSDDLDDASADNLSLLMDSADQLIETHASLLQQWAKKLRANAELRELH